MICLLLHLRLEKYKMALHFLIPLSLDFLYNLWTTNGQFRYLKLLSLRHLTFSLIILTAKIGTVEFPKSPLSESGRVSVLRSLVYFHFNSSYFLSFSCCQNGSMFLQLVFLMHPQRWFHKVQLYYAWM